MTAVSSNVDLWADCEALYRREALALQRRAFEDWLGLFADDLYYVVPTFALVETESGPAHLRMPLAYYEETLQTLGVRVKKLASRSSWGEIPPSRNRYFLQLLEVSAGVDVVHATTNILLLQHRENLDQTFSGERFDELRRDDDGQLKIVRREVSLDRPLLGSQGLSVFF